MRSATFVGIVVFAFSAPIHAEEPERTSDLELELNLHASVVREGEPLVLDIALVNSGSEDVKDGLLIPQGFRDTTLIGFEVRRGAQALPTIATHGHATPITTGTLGPNERVRARKSVVPYMLPNGHHELAKPGRYEIRAVLPVGNHILTSRWHRFGITREADSRRIRDYEPASELAGVLMGLQIADDSQLPTLIEGLRKSHPNSPHLMHLEFRAVESASSLEVMREKGSAFLERYGSSPYTDQVLILLGRAAEQDDDFETAADHYQRLLAGHPESPWAVDAKQRLDSVTERLRTKP